MTTTLYKSETRGYSELDWLESYHTFSFSGYYEPSRMHFGLLRVFNDDVIAAGKGFGTHPHDNMEIVSIGIRGALEHRDSTGGHHVINSNDVQVMSAGSGIYHSEYNHSSTEPAAFLQIWILTRSQNITPRYDQKTFPHESRLDALLPVVSSGDIEGTLSINQDARVFLSDLSAGKTVTYDNTTAGHGAFLFVIEGEIEAAGETLGARDAIGVADFNSMSIHAKSPSRMLLIDVPMR
jgi:redox-sensitive bicupin YhaK (pirin superfamily)